MMACANASNILGEATSASGNTSIEAMRPSRPCCWNRALLRLPEKTDGASASVGTCVSPSLEDLAHRNAVAIHGAILVPARPKLHMLYALVCRE